MLLYKKITVILIVMLIIIEDTFYKAVEKIALTDSWTIDKASLTNEQKQWMQENAVHYVASNLPVGEEISSGKGKVCKEVSAGHNKHEYTTGYAFDEIIKFFGV